MSSRLPFAGTTFKLVDVNTRKISNEKTQHKGWVLSVYLFREVKALWRWNRTALSCGVLVNLFLDQLLALESCNGSQSFF